MVYYAYHLGCIRPSNIPGLRSAGISEIIADTKATQPSVTSSNGCRVDLSEVSPCGSVSTVARNADDYINACSSTPIDWTLCPISPLWLHGDTAHLRNPTGIRRQSPTCVLHDRGCIVGGLWWSVGGRLNHASQCGHGWLAVRAFNLSPGTIPVQFDPLHGARCPDQRHHIATSTGEC